MTSNLARTIATSSSDLPAALEMATQIGFTHAQNHPLEADLSARATAALHGELRDLFAKADGMPAMNHALAHAAPPTEQHAAPRAATPGAIHSSQPGQVTMPRMKAPPAPQFTPPTAPHGETRPAMMTRLKTAITAHVEQHKAHLDHISSEYGVKVPMGHVAYTSGGPGSGKSTYLKGHHFQHGVFAHVDADAMKEHITGYDKKNPHLVHEESKALAAHFQAEATKHKLPIILDQTGANWRKINRQATEFHTVHGYTHVGINHVQVRPEVSVARNKLRDRSIPEETVRAEAMRHLPDHMDEDGGNMGRSPLGHIRAHLKASGIPHSVHVHDSENDDERKERSASGWHKYLSSTTGIAKAVYVTLLSMFRTAPTMKRRQQA